MARRRIECGLTRRRQPDRDRAGREVAGRPLVGRSRIGVRQDSVRLDVAPQAHLRVRVGRLVEQVGELLCDQVRGHRPDGLEPGDRKSTRLNSSHGYISYAVFCLKKKKKNSQSLDSKSPM